MCHSIDFKAYVYLNACKLFLRNEQACQINIISGGTAMNGVIDGNNIYGHFFLVM